MTCFSKGSVTTFDGSSTSIKSGKGLVTGVFTLESPVVSAVPSLAAESPYMLIRSAKISSLLMPSSTMSRMFWELTFSGMIEAILLPRLPSRSSRKSSSDCLDFLG